MMENGHNTCDKNTPGWKKDHKILPFFALVKQIHSSLKHMKHLSWQNLKKTQKLLVSL
jgi:hypothetical protein